MTEINLAKGTLGDAEANVKQAQQIFQKAADTTGEAMVHYYLAWIAFQKGQLKAALQSAEKARKTFSKQKDIHWQAKSQLLAAKILTESNQEREALHLFDKAIELFSLAKEKNQSMWAHVEKGKTLLCIGQERSAEREFTQALQYYRELKHGEQEARIYIEVAECMNGLGKYNEAREQCLQAIEQLKEEHDEEREIQAYRVLFQIAQGRRRFEEDIPLFRDALEKAKSQEKPILRASISVSLAQLKIDSDSPEKAIAILEEAKGDNRLPNEQRAEVNLQLGLVLMKQRKFTEAVEPLREATTLFGLKQMHNKAIAYYQLSEALKRLKQKPQRQTALEGAIASLPSGVDEKLQAQISLELAPLIAPTDKDRAIQYYEQALKFFEMWDYPEKRFIALLGEATVLTSKGQHQKALQNVAKALLLAEELDIPLQQQEMTSKSFIHLQQAVEIAILVVSQKSRDQKETDIAEKIFDWSTRRKVARILPLLPNNLGFEKCTELPTLLQKENKLLQQAAKLRMNLRKIPRTKITKQEYTKKCKVIRSDLENLLNEINVNRFVISAACPDPGRSLPPRDYKTFQKIIALMPPKRRWIIISYDLFQKRNRLTVTVDDHINRQAVYTLPISQDLISLISKLHVIGKTNVLPPAAHLENLGINLYRRLLPNQLKKELMERTYDYIQIITDDFLHHVPFELFFDGNQYWGLKYPMNWAPNLQFLESTLKAQALAYQETPSVMIGVNTGPENQPRRKSKAEELLQSFLSAASNEHEGSEPVVLFGQDFTRQEFLNACKMPRALIYLSTPTKIHHSKGEITLLHPDSFRSIEIGVTTKFEGAPILVLDESTQLEPLENGTSLATFLRRLVTAGASSIVFTRCLPNPQIQSHFTSTLTHRLYERDPVAVALLHTRRELANRQTSPNSWLPYTLAGNPFASLF
jgi:tetratricopeptide (TPR) repeat protein